MQIDQLNGQGVAISRACEALGLARSSYYYRKQPAAPARERRRYPTPARALPTCEREAVREVLNSDRFADQPPRQVYATLLDEGIYHCSVSTMYRILNEHGEVVERRDQRQHPLRTKPRLAATAPNHLWSWDITKLPTGRKFAYFFLYVIIDVFSRYVVGWMVAENESAEHAQHLIAHACQQQQVSRDQLTLHSDNGSPMIALTTAQLLTSLGVQKSHSRPYTPNDNPFSEAHFKTLKYRPDFPDAFSSADHACQWSRSFFHWYNNDHHHAALSLLTPAVVHFGATDRVLQQRDAVLHNAYLAHPERFVRGLPVHPKPPHAVWINPPEHAADAL